VLRQACPLKHALACLPKNNKPLGLLNVAQNTYPAARLLVSQFAAFRLPGLKGWIFSDAALRMVWAPRSFATAKQQAMHKHARGNTEASNR
ncbi:hypothetical protein, partial [Pusillimonas noertemannii]|uniref:hypothetical protein n=1 Tax=Pusillimonas noertemannii TaxID=305977 RepID=UPI001AD933FF